MLWALRSQHAVFGSQTASHPVVRTWCVGKWLLYITNARSKNSWGLRAQRQRLKKTKPQMKITDAFASESWKWEWGALGRLNCLFAHPAPWLSVGDQEAQTERTEAWGRQKKHHVSSPNKNREAPIPKKVWECSCCCCFNSFKVATSRTWTIKGSSVSLSHLQVQWSFFYFIFFLCRYSSYV